MPSHLNVQLRDEAPCVSPMRCNWLLDQRGVNERWPLDRQPCPIHPCCIVPSEYLQVKMKRNVIRARKRVVFHCLFNTVAVSVVVFSFAKAYIPSMRQKEKRGNVEIITVTGTTGSLFGTLLACFAQLASTGHWTQTSYRCSWHVVVFISLKKKKWERHCIHSATRWQVCLRAHVCNVSSW